MSAPTILYHTQNSWIVQLDPHIPARSMDSCAKQCLSQDLDLKKKKELLKFFRELFAKERSYTFHGENLANVYQMRILCARTCRNHLVNRRFRTL